MTHPRFLLLGCSLLAIAGAPSAQGTNGDAAPAAEPGSRIVKLVGMSGAYADLAEQSFDMTAVLMGGGGGKTKSFYDLTEQLDRLTEDDTSDTVLFDLSQSVGLNQPQLAEIERTMAKLKAAGKTSIAYIEGAGRTQYSIAALCDEILLADMGGLDIGALSMSSSYMKDALDLLGVQMDVVRCGDFKGAAEPFMLSRMSTHLRNHYLEMLERMNDDIVRRIAKGRGMARDKVRELQKQRMFTAEEALVAGLVDRLVPWKGAHASLEDFMGGEEIELKNALKKKKKKRLNFMAMMTNLFNPKDEEEEVEEAALAVLHLSGPIVDGKSGTPGMIVSGASVKTIESLRDNENIKGVVVRINSPGGSATASEAIVLALAELAEKKPVVCSMGYVAASGGYYVTCFGRPIFAEAGTITGSIGVLGVKPNVGPLMRRIGMHEELIALDEAAAITAINRPWSEEAKARIQESVNGVYDRFLNHVAKSRGMERSEVEAIAGGRVWSGDQAVERGLVDEIGGLDAALAKVAHEAEVEDYDIIHVPRPRNFMDTFAEELFQVRAMFADSVPMAVLRRLQGLRTPLAVLLDAFGDNPTRVWAVMPAEIRVH